eukprot:m.55303 g.55303  ORF g.55303 m.55303 type:complete len:83 (-) comp11473_c0_seq3:1063-1311(-)
MMLFDQGSSRVFPTHLAIDSHSYTCTQSTRADVHDVYMSGDAWVCYTHTLNTTPLTAQCCAAQLARVRGNTESSKESIVERC